MCTGTGHSTVPSMQQLSTYAEDLLSDAKARYKKKLEVIGGNDPLLFGRIGEVVDCLPDVVLDYLSSKLLIVLFASVVTT